jgi:hypothetical protein
MASKQPLFACSACKAGKNPVSSPQDSPVPACLTGQTPDKPPPTLASTADFEQRLQTHHLEGVFLTTSTFKWLLTTIS